MNTFCKNLLCTLVLLMMSATISGQNRYRVVDAETGEPLPGALLYISDGKGAWTNDEGDAELTVGDGEQVKISYVGYQSQILKKSELTSTIGLKSLIKDMQDVSVESDWLFLERLAKKLNKEANSKRNHRVPFFSRITLQTLDGNEMIESFLEAGSAGSIHAIKLHNGLYYSLSAAGKSASSLRRTNLHNIFCLGPTLENDPFWKGYEGPLHQGVTATWLKRNYQLSSEVYINDEGEGLRCITMTPKYRFNMVGGKIYVRTSTMEPVFFEGKMESNAVVYSGEDSNASSASRASIKFSINYTNRDGFCEVDNMTFSLDAKGTKCQSAMINMGKYEVKDEMTWPREIGKNLVTAINDVGYNPALDKYLTIMKRTELEDALVNGQFYAMQEEADENDDATSSHGWKDALPQEKVYLHLDNTGYFKGETIWFKAYVVRTDTEKRGNLSRVLYVDLVSPQGDVMASKKIYVNYGIGAGSITLDNAVMPTGFYELRAYTRYMTNWSKNACFSRIIPVFQEPRKEGDYTPVLDKETQLTAIETAKEEKVAFYPEGGYLVKGLPSRVAYIVKGMRGVVDVPASEDPQSIEITANGSTRSYALPKALDEGISMKVDALRDDSLKVDIWATRGIQGKELGYALIHSGKVMTSETFKASEHQAFSISRDELPDGVSQITIFDPEAGALADRFVFRMPKYEDSLQIQSSTTKLMPCGKVSMDIKAEPFTSLSFSAMDAGSTVNGIRGNIKTWMLLGSDIKGYIENPEYYFESDDEEHRKAADLLMMIQGWRRYDWDAMNGRKKSTSMQPFESKLAIDGRIKAKKGTNTDVANVKITATLHGAEESFGLSAMTDSTGYYVIILPDMEGEWAMSISASKNGISDQYIIPINRHFSPDSRKPEKFEVAQMPIESLQIHHWDIPEESEAEWKKFLDAKGTTLREVSVRKKRLDNFNYSGFSDEKNAVINSTLFYDCEKAVEDCLDRGEEPPYLVEWLKTKDKMFTGGIPSDKMMWAAIGDTLSMVRQDFPFLPGMIFDTSDLQYLDYRYSGNGYGTYDDFAPNYWVPVWRDGLEINGRPVVWMVNNLYCSITKLNLKTDVSVYDRLDVGIVDSDNDPELNHSIRKKLEAKHTRRAPCMGRLTKPTVEIPDLLEDVKSLYIAEGKNLAFQITTSSEIGALNPYVVYCYTKSGYGNRKKVKGIRYTSFQGFDPVEVFQTEDYGEMPPMDDFRRTLYWNPNVWTDEKGEAHVEFWNNSTCTDMIISAEGVTDDGKFVIGQ